jgi:hypothetical protein
MKREIKFRAWSKKDKVMVDVAAINFGPSGLWSLIEDADDEELQLADSYELMQFTGLTDKNGREIYEGDLFEHRFGYMVFDDPPHDEMGTECGVVVLEDGQFGVKIPGLGVYNLYGLLLREGHLDNMPKDDLFVMKIAGNIYENPELLEGKHE